MSKNSKEPIPLRKINPETGKSEYAGSQSRAGKDGPTPAVLPHDVKSFLSGNQNDSDATESQLEEAYALLHRKVIRPGVKVGNVLQEAVDATEIIVVTPRCWSCGDTGTLSVNAGSYRAFQMGILVQDAFPDLEAPLREQLKTGIHPACWHNLLPPTK